jgi:GT2 family glycosyltransferase
LAYSEPESIRVAKQDREDASSARKISFVIPAHNEEAELPKTLQSIHLAAFNARCDYEIILVDDGSTDATAFIAKKFGSLVISIDRRQIAAARNAGARAARGDIFVFVDADTHITSEHVRGVMGALDSGCVGGGCRLQLDDKIPLWGKILFNAFARVYFAFQLGAGAFLFATRPAFFAAGGFDETYFAGEEVLFTFALKKLGHFKILPEPAITSGRKLRLYSGRKILQAALTLMLAGQRAMRSRAKLDLWYGGKRERSLR